MVARVGVILSYFQYFHHFSRLDSTAEYSFITARGRFSQKEIRGLTFVDWKQHTTTGDACQGDITSYFAFSEKMNAIPAKVDKKKLAAHFERSIERFLVRNGIEFLITGGVTGFERIGLAVSKRLCIPALCVWEGFFRPNTISCDPDGMNAESSFARLRSDEIANHNSSPEAREFVRSFVQALNQPHPSKDLATVLGGRFRIATLVRNRIKDLNDLERVRLPFRQHAYARLSYYRDRKNYTAVNNLAKPFVFFPLQTSTDSNVVLHAYTFPYSELVNSVIREFRANQFQLSCDLVIKEHPFDVLRTPYVKSLGEHVHWLSPEIPVLSVLQNPLCLGTIVANSTAGFESLLMEKPVLSLGKSVYCRPEMVEIFSGTGLQREGLANSMKNLLTRKVDLKQVVQFAQCLYDKTQSKGNLDDTPGKEQVDEFKARWFSHER